MLFVFGSILFFNCSNSIHPQDEKIKVENFVNYIAQNFKTNFNQVEGCNKPNIFGDSITISNFFADNRRPYYIKFFIKHEVGISCEYKIHSKIDIPLLNSLKYKRDTREVLYELDMRKFDIGLVPMQFSIHEFETKLLIEGKSYKGMMQFSNDYYKNDNYKDEHKFVLELFYFFE